jgi:hypothetical protein
MVRWRGGRRLCECATGLARDGSWNLPPESDLCPMFACVGLCCMSGVTRPRGHMVESDVSLEMELYQSV